MSNISKEMRKLMETLHEYDAEVPTTPRSPKNSLDYIPDRPGTSHIVKKPHERAAADAVNHINKVLSYLDKIEELDPTVKSQILLKAEELVQKLA